LITLVLATYLLFFLHEKILLSQSFDFNLYLLLSLVESGRQDAIVHVAQDFQQKCQILSSICEIQIEWKKRRHLEIQ
jgi:hypothetical protein